MAPNRSLRPVHVATAGLLVLLLCAPDGRATTPSLSDSAVGRMLGPFVTGDLDDPQSLRALWRQDKATLPAPVLLALADALLRAHKTRMAEEVLEHALERAQDPETAGWAALGLGWLELASGDAPSAQARFEAIARDGQWGSLLASALVGLAAASRGDVRAAALLDEIARTDESPYALKIATRLATGYAYLWAGQYQPAADAFGHAAAEYPECVLTDDARFGAGVALTRLGETRLAEVEFGKLADEHPGGDDGALPATLVDLTPGGVLRATLRRYRGAGFGPPEEQLVRMLDLDGRALALAAATRDGGAAAVVAGTAGAGVVTTAAEPPSDDGGAETARTRTAGSARAAWSFWLPWLALLLLALVLLRRRHASTARSASRAVRR
jgi:tetratricopeptide (TPR) repeat protein